MTSIQNAPERHDPDEWVFHVTNWCRQCGTEWTIDRGDKEAPIWRWFLGILPKVKTSVIGPGVVTESMWFVKYYPAETGISGEFLVSRCPTCGTYHHKRKPALAGYAAGDVREV